ncbi:hypothetical protein BD289DRAFT_455273 [Coniella lustricola]|uniref:5-formyltetrahydrofolate cyclo-ligase n=1 Tax=Coniella lustricola TaxID=2025994 RepID=A0A2T3A0F5_9PEZI|nr:hypothetical protein BD289DRAFT_455273 [Coniella lustricola]
MSLAVGHGYGGDNVAVGSGSGQQQQAQAQQQQQQPHKASVRAKVWNELRKVAVPDSRFHFDFSSFITDFADSQAANEALLAHACFARATCVFITPDNCLEYLRERALAAGKRVLITTYGIRRGFWLLDPAEIRKKLLLGESSDDGSSSSSSSNNNNDDDNDEMGNGKEHGNRCAQGNVHPWAWKYAATLDGMEKVGRPVSLQEIAGLGLEVGLMVTGTGAINTKGIRFGKGHGFFDLEWAMLYSLGVVSVETATAAVVHDCQVLEEELVAEMFDTVCDLIVTPTRVIEADVVGKPTCGVLWDLLEEGMLEDIPPLQELRTLLKVVIVLVVPAKP